MPSSSEPAPAEVGYVEWVRPRDNALESRYVFLAVLAIVLAGVASLVFLHRDGPRAFALPVALTSVATQLSNAREEIRLLQDLDLLGPTPGLADLVEAELPPFERSGASQPEAGCIVFDLEPYLVRFSLSPLAGEGWEIAWLDERDAPDIQHAMHVPGEGESPCEDHGEWQRYEAGLG